MARNPRTRNLVLRFAFLAVGLVLCGLAFLISNEFAAFMLVFVAIFPLLAALIGPGALARFLGASVDRDKYHHT